VLPLATAADLSVDLDDPSGVVANPAAVFEDLLDVLEQVETAKSSYTRHVCERLRMLVKVQQHIRTLRRSRLVSDDFNGIS
jgi:hypothetical protein